MKLFSQRNKEGGRNESLRDLYILLTHQYKHYGSPKERKEKEAKDLLKQQWLKIKSEGRNGHPHSKSSNNIKKMNSKKLTLRHIVIKLSIVKDKDRILKASREKQTIKDKGTPIKLSTISHQKYYKPEEWDDKFKAMEEKKLPTKILYLEKLSFKNDKGQMIKTTHINKR